jgi:probable O-glycosylation ligase (exosortase A-associated)
MKQFAFTILATLVGMGGAVTLSPVYGLAVYYLFAVLRPQTLWEWVELGGYRLDDFNWSFYVAVTTLIATAAWRLGLLAPARVAAPPWYGEPKFTRSHYLFLAFTAWISLTYVTAENRERAWPYFVEYVKIFVMFLCATVVLRSVRDLWVIYLAVLAAAVYLGYEVNAYYLLDRKLLLDVRGHGGLDNNGAALILGMAVPMCFFAWEAVRRWYRWAFLLAVPPLLHAIMLSYSRGGMLSLCLIAPLVLLRTRHKVLVAVVFGCVLLSLPVVAGKEIRERFFSIGKTDVDDSAQSRWTTWKIAVKMATERPLFGFGIRNSNLFTYAYGADIPGRSIHSQYLQTAADSGWVALGLYVGLLGSALVGLWDVRRATAKWNDPETARVRSLAAGLECALVLFCIGAAFLSLEHFEMPYVIILLSVQLHAITRAVLAKLEAAGPAQPGLPAAVRPDRVAPAAEPT